ncbi:hypothetical protein LQ50_14985 [Halalkalibacter okhensis]|uniref:Uncharacterized protein n=1 Tax=Halalkalibacter okhensis TaxID=333138 RepID=A0A0B0IIQ1_9BACI|nr:hypothetical protein LQ50_14985 [Halalkalibacter okhensis]
MSELLKKRTASGAIATRIALMSNEGVPFPFFMILEVMSEAAVNGFKLFERTSQKAHGEWSHCHQDCTNVK